MVEPRSMPALRVALLRGWGRTAAGSIVVVFATLLGSLPRPPLPDDAAPEAVLETVLQAQSAAGLEPFIDGGWAPAGLRPPARRAPRAAPVAGRDRWKRRCRRHRDGARGGLREPRRRPDRGSRQLAARGGH